MPCRHCGQTFARQLVTLLGRSFYRGNTCEACTENANRPRETEDVLRERRRRAWLEFCPEGYLPLRDSIPEPLMAWMLTAWRTRAGIMLHGTSGSWKTTAMLHCICARIIGAGGTVERIDPVAFREGATDAAKHSRTKQFLAQYKAAPWLYLDDFGAASYGHAATDAMQALLEARRSSGKPLLITTQLEHRQAFIDRFASAEQGEAIITRIYTLCPNRLCTTPPQP